MYGCSSIACDGAAGRGGGEGARAELRQRKGAAVGLDPTTFRHGASRPDQTDGDDR